MEGNNNTQKLYSTLVQQGYDDLGTFDQFEGKLKDSGKREKLYSVLQNEGFSDLGDFKTFEAKLGYGIENAQSLPADSYWKDTGERFLSGAANFAGGALNLMDKGAKKLDKWTGGVLESKGGLGEWGQEMKDYAAGMHERSDRYQGKSFVELAKEGDYAGALGEIFLSATESLPTSVGIAATGGVGLVGVGAVTASDKYDEIKTQNPHMNESAAVGNAIATGLSESLTEVFGAGTIGSMIRGALKTGGKKEAGNLIYNFITDRAKKMMDKHWFSAPIASEALEEMANATTEYAVDKLTGVQRDDNPIETILKAGVYGAAGGAQFTPATTAAHFYSQSKKKKITTAYKESSEIAKNLLENNFEQFNETVSRFKDNGKQLEDFVKNVISVKNLNPQQTEQLIRYTSDLLNYNNYVEYVQSRVDEETKRRMDEVDQMANKDMGTVVSVQSGLFDEPLFITGGRITFDNEGLVDVNNSDKVLYYKDGDGKIQQITPDKLEKLVSQTPVEKMYAEIMGTVPAQVISEEEIESEGGQATFNPGDSVQLPDGRNGTVQQMDEDGNVLVNIDGFTEAIPVDAISGFANILQENVSPNLSFESQSNASEQQTFPMKGEDIDYDAIQDPQTYANALIAEFAEDAGTTVDEIIASQEADLEKAMKSSDVIKRKRAERKIKAELNRLNQVKEIISPTVNESIQENTPAMSQAEIAAPIDQTIESGVEESVVQPVVNTEISKPETPISRIPTNEAGEPIYHKADIQDTLDDLLDGNLSIEEVDQFVAERNKDVTKRLQSLKNKAPKIGTNKAQYIADKQAWQTQINELQQESDYWNEVDRELKDSREKPGDEAALTVLSNMQPLTGEEMAARMLASGSVKLLREEYERETGGGPRESRSMFGLFAGKDKGGVSIERAGEILMQEDLENGTNLFDQNDPNAGRNAIIEVLSSARTRGDLINYIKNNRAIKAEQERQAQYNEYAIWCEENYRLSPEDYEAYEEDMRKQAEAVTNEAVEYVNGEIADEIQSIIEEQEEIDAILAQNKKSDEKVERNDERGIGGLHEGSDQLLQEEQPIQTGRTGKTEQEYAGTNDRVDNEDGTAQEGSSEELDENGYSFIISPDGTTSFGEIRSETGLTPAPIKLSDGFQTEDGKGYGLKHIEARHGDQIRNAGYTSVVDFVQKVASDYEVIKRGNERGLNSTYLLEVQDKYNNTLFIELSNDNSYWNVNSAGIFKKGYSKNKDIVWTLPAVSSNTIADVTGVNRGQEYGETATSGNSPQTIPLSTNKDKISSSENQVNKDKSFVAPTPKENENPLDYADRIVEAKKLYDEERKVDVNPTDAQKEAGNYKKGHIKINGFDVTIEQPTGSVRSGKDANGKEWSVTMNNTYGYIRGTEGVDGDHIDVFLGPDTSSNMVYVVDQVNTDGSFDEHKVMMGFPSLDEARSAYLSNYEEGWQGLGNITGVALDEFKKWITSSTRKTKPFVEYKSVTTSDVKKGYTIEKRHHEKKNKDIYAVNFDKRYSRDEFLKIKAEAKSHGGYYSSFGKKGYIFDEFENAERFAKSVSGMKQTEEDVTFEVPLIERGEDILEYASRVAEKKTSFDNKGYKVGDKVLYKGNPATITDFENDGRPILDTGNAPVLYEIANWDDIQNLSEKNISLKAWSGMSAEERMAEAEKTPLSEDEITNAPTDEVNKANAIDYLRGNHGFIQSISYLKVYEDVRNSNRNTATDSSSTNTSQLDEAGNRNSDGLGAGREGRKSPERMDRRNGSENVSRQRIDGTDRERSLFDNIGEGGDSNLPSSEQPVDAISSGSTESGRGSNAGSTGSDGGQRRRKAGPNHATTDGRRDTDARRSPDERTSTGKTEVDAEIDAALREFDDILSEFKQAGKETLNLSFAGMNSRQMEILPRLISAGAKVGYAYIKKGIYSFAEWMKQMREAFGDNLHAAGLSDTEVDAFITEMWKSKLPMNGEMHTLEEWAGILGKENFRKKISTTLDEKRKAQHAVENVKVKVCDRENIAETLPFLLPQQQDDVLKAETQFFDESHNDREHAFGKGYMFTNGTGTGKTYTGLGIVKRFIKQGKGRILILTPSQTKVSDWIKDAANLDIELNDLDAVAKAKKDETTAITEKGEGAVITTYANFRQNQALLEDDFDLIVYDESHRLLENKGGIGTTGSKQHYKISNRNENYAFLRLQDINPDWKTLKAKEEEFNDKRNAIIARLQKETGITDELAFEQRGELPPVFNGSWNESAERKFPEIANLRKKIIELYAKYNKEIKPELERQAKENVKRTKTVFLSATPFNTRENLDYVEGYIFSYPESEKQDGYSVQSPRSQFYLERFGAGYKWRYHRLENSVSNPEAVSKQEIGFSDYLQHTLQTMSGRIIDSPYDYSRDFPTVTMDKAEEFNNAMEELAHESATGHAFYTVMGDYNYTGALFESMKVAQIIPRLKEHLARGRKAVIFHRRIESKNPVVPPFSAIFAQAVKDLNDVHDASERDKKRHKISALRRKYAGILEWEQDLDLRMPREQLADAFGKNNVLFFSGKESKKTKDKAVEDFNNDDSGKNIIVIQEASGKEGISLHDVTGKHQRVLITLALPQSPITALQIEGRIYRIGNKSNAIFEYPLLGLNTELMLFGQKFNQQVSTTENLALGSQARNLRESFSRGVEEHSGNVDIDNQGVGGKEFDAPNPIEENSFDNAVLDYYTNQKLTGKRDNREGIDFYPTPEPLGFMLNQWGRISEGESVLEPSAGHGAIARYVPRENPLTAVEPSQRLFSKLQIKAGGNGRKFENTIFENYNVVNKHDVVLMNPPFGTGGKLAVDHVAKAFQHLEEGGRIVAIIPRGSTDKKFNKWYDEQKNAVLTAEIGLPSITFERAGTNVSCRTVVIDKVTNENLRSQAASNAVHVDLSTIRYDKIEDFFEDIRDISVPERTIDQKMKLKRKAAPVARELRTVKGVRDVSLTDEKIYVSGRGVWASIEWGDKKGDALTSYLSEEYRRFLNNYDYAAKEENEFREVVYGEMKALACKLAGMTEDEMQRYIGRKKDDIRYRFIDEKGAVNLDKEVNQKFNEELQRYQNGEMGNNEMFHLGNPEGAMKLLLPNLPIVMRQRILTKGSVKKHNVAPESLLNMPKSLSEPIFIFKREDNALGVLTEMKDRDGKNVCVAIALNKVIQDGKETIEVNDIRSIHGRNEADVIFPIVQNGTLRWIDKQKGLDWLSSASRYVQQEIGDQDLSSATKILESFVNPTIEEGKIASAVDELAGSLNTSIHIIGVNEITDDNQGLQSQKRGAKGWYNPTTGETYLVLQNAESIADAQATVLHEVVAHKGLRGLLGDKFSDMMDTVYKNLPEDVRREVATDAIHHYKFDFRTATEEYLASIAEHGIKNLSTWQKIKSAIREFFRSLGVKMVMRDEDIAYMLWKSKNRLEKRDFLPTLLEKTAKDAEMRATLLYRNPLITSGTLLNANLEERRSLMDVIKDISDGLKGNSPYIKKFYQRFREGYQDRMLPLRNFQREVERGRGIQIKDFEDAYTYENTTQGKAQYDVDRFKETELRNLLNEVAKLSKVNGAFDKQKNRDVETYMMVKHGLERNAKKREEELKAIKSPSQETIDAIKEKDYSGLTSLTKELFEKEGMDEVALKNWMEDFEKNNDTTGLWRSVKAATHATLEKMYQTNQISREEMNSLKDMYEYYIPLKEWDETTAGDLYDYFDRGDTDIITNPIKTANGRKSRAGNILANIAHDYESAVLIGYKNLTKLRFANLVRNSKTDKAVVSGQWYVKSGVDLEGNPVWEPVVAEGFTENMEENAKIINDFEESMRELHKNGDAKTQKEILQLGVPIKSWQERQHVVRVKEGGRDLVIYINGDPRVSQAINGLNNKHLDASGLRWLNKVRQFMMLNYTSRSVNFILRNFVRDFLYTNTMNWVKYGGEFEGKYFKTFFPAIRAIAKYSFGTSPKNLKEKQLFDAYEAFKKGGGRTGFVEVMGYDKYKREVDRMLRKSAGGKLQVKDVFNTLGGWLEVVNSVIEDSSRFATYLTAKNLGISELQSIKAAKEASVNFNRRGSGAYGGAIAQNFYFFFNAAIQGSHNFLNAAKNNRIRAFLAIGMWSALGYAYSALMHDLLGDDDEYNDIPDYVRQNNVIVPTGTGKYVLLPLPVELRIFYGLGDMAAQFLRGEYKGRDFGSDVVGKLMELSPKNFEGNISGINKGEEENIIGLGLKNFSPDAIRPFLDALYFNENFFGKRITGRNDYNTYVPEYQKVTSGTSKTLIRASDAINRLTGGDYATKGNIDPVILNPSVVEYIFEQYFGGVGKAIGQVYKTIEGGRTGDIQLRNVPIISGLSYDTENMLSRNYTNERYNNYLKLYEEMASRERMYWKGVKKGENLTKELTAFRSDKDYRKYQIVEYFKKQIDSIYNMAKLTDDKKEQIEFYDYARDMKQKMINEIDKIDNE